MIEVAWPAAVGKNGPWLDLFALCRLPSRFGLKEYFWGSSDIPVTAIERYFKDRPGQEKGFGQLAVVRAVNGAKGSVID